MAKQQKKRIEQTGTANGYARTHEELAAAVGCHERTIRKLLAAGGPPRTPKGFPVAEWRSFLEDRRGPENLREELLRSKIELNQLRITIETLRNERATQKVVPVGDLQRAVNTLARYFVDVLEAAPAALELLLADKRGPEIRPAVKEYFDARRWELIARIKKKPAEARADEAEARQS